jgi:dipeptidyl aminopeptidase/acylaminoacyl peptidase
MEMLTGRAKLMHNILRLLLVSGIVLALIGCGGKPTAAPVEISTTIPTSTPLLASTSAVTPTATALPALTGSGGGVIVFASWQKNDWQIHLINADGSGDRRVDNRHGYEPNWSPDGTKLVFQYNGLWIAELASGEISGVPLSVAGNNLPNEYLVKPAWSPDGDWIAFLNESGMFGDLYLIHPDGTNLTRLTTTNDISRDGDLVWSPDGSQIAYSANRDGNIEIYLLDVASAVQGKETARQLTGTDAPVRNLVTSWSRVDSRLAFSSDRDGNTEIYIMSPDGSNVIRLTNNLAYDAEPAWSPDGKKIAFSSDREGNLEIYVLDVESAAQNADASNATRLTNHPGDDVGPVWMPTLPRSIFSQIPDQIDPQALYVIYLHGKLVEDQGPQNPTDPRFGLYDYSGILNALAADDNQVISEVRSKYTDSLGYVDHVIKQINTLLNAGVAPDHISVVGFSKGGAIAIFVSSKLNNDSVKYVILAGSCQVASLEQDKDIIFNGQVLSIYEASDEYGQSCQEIADRSPKSLVFKEIRLDTGLAHGEFYMVREEWLIPVLDWIRK